MQCIIYAKTFKPIRDALFNFYQLINSVIWVNAALCFAFIEYFSLHSGKKECYREENLFKTFLLVQLKFDLIYLQLFGGHVYCVQEGTAASLNFFFFLRVILQLGHQVLSSHKLFSFSVN